MKWFYDLVQLLGDILKVPEIRMGDILPES